ncbi:unnamed protein product [Pelagomonas calceolata]|uniref:Protein xylosyltransferase n=1 Tax=Pelagomonas calceolata TaxID=35677 RepID=A0A8J2SH98_9STRA|nr:unnamed protein product [Pelagomonas calceolata]
MMPTWRCPSMTTTTLLAIAVLATARSSAAAITGVGTLLSGSGSSAGRGLALGVLLASPHLAAARPFGAANTSVAASPPACRAGLGSFQVNISDVFEGATCYGRRYPDLEYAFCSKDECNVQALHRHFQSHGRREGRRFGCEAAPLTAAETAKYKVHALTAAVTAKYKVHEARRRTAKYEQVACRMDHRVGACDNRLDVGRQGSHGVTCRPVGGNCACGRPADLDAAAARTGAAPGGPATRNATRICAYVRSYNGHKSVIGTMLQTMRAAVRAAGTPVDLEVHLANTDWRLPLLPCFRRRVAFEASCVDQNASGSFEIHERFDDRYQRAETAFRRRWGVTVKKDYGYILTDLWLLEMRRRGGCDFIHVTNGDNIYHVDFFRHQLAVFNARPDVGSTAVDFSCHLRRNFHSVAFNYTHIDLGCMLVRPSAMRNMTFAVRLFEDGKPQPSKRRLYAADGFLAAELARRAPAVPIHDHGPLFFHL